MIRKLMILILIVLLAYIFYSEFMADSLEPFFKKYGEKPLFYQIRIPKEVASESEFAPVDPPSSATLSNVSR